MTTYRTILIKMHTIYALKW